MKSALKGAPTNIKLAIANPALLVRIECLMALVVFLRGVNVGGHRIFRPTLVANQLSDFDVVNVGAAGTFVVRNRISQGKLRAELRRRLPFEAEVVICKGNDVLESRIRGPVRRSTHGIKDRSVCEHFGETRAAFAFDTPQSSFACSNGL